MVTNSFGNQKYMHSQWVGWSMHSKCLDFFSFKFWVLGGGGGGFFHFSFVPNMFPSSSQFVPYVPKVSPNVFWVASHFNPRCFAQSPPLHTYIGGPKGEALHLPTESSILGSLHKFNFFCDGPIKLTHCNIKKVGLVRYPQLINMKQNNRYPSSWEAVLAQAKNGCKQF